VVLLAGGVVALVIELVPGRNGVTQHFSPGPVQRVTTERQVPLTAADRRAINRTLDRFVPAAVGVAAGSIGLGPAMGICSAGSYVFVLLAVALLPETRGRELESTVVSEARDAIRASYSPQPVPR